MWEGPDCINPSFLARPASRINRYTERDEAYVRFQRQLRLERLRVIFLAGVSLGTTSWIIYGWLFPDSRLITQSWCWLVALLQRGLAATCPCSQSGSFPPSSSVP